MPRGVPRTPRRATPPPGRSEPPAVVVNADDLGMSDAVNEAVLRALDAGLVTSATIMANMPGFATACAEIVGRGLGDRVGVHLNLTTGEPLTEAIRQCPRLCDPQGRLRPRSRPRWRLRDEEEAAIEAELDAQVEAVLASGIRPSHLDSHHHVHTQWPIATIVIRVARRHGVPAVRLARNCGREPGLLRRAYRRLLNLRLARAGLAPTRRFGSSRDAATLVASDGPVEIMVHPSLDAAGRLVDLTSASRELADVVDRWRAGGRLVGYRALGRPVADGDAARSLRIAMALYGDVTYDSRVIREAETLCRAGHSVTICCVSGRAPASASFGVLVQAPGRSGWAPGGGSPFLRASGSSPARRTLARVRWLVGYARDLRAWGRWAVGSAGDVDVWHAHDLTALMAVGPLVRPPQALVYDSHEIFLETGTGVRLPSPLRRALSWYEGRLARRAYALVTVNEGYADVLRRRTRHGRLTIVRNCPPRWEPPAGGSPLRGACGVGASEPLVLYHGMFSPMRGIEQLAEALLEPGLEAAHLACLGFGATREALEELARDPRLGGRLHVLDPVAPDELLAWVAGADVDAIPLQRSTLNHWLCSPNKLWESLAAGVPVVVSDFPVMRRVVLGDPAGPLGAVCDPSSPASIAVAIASIVDMPGATRDELRARCLRAARERWSWERESVRLVDVYDEIRLGLPGLGPA